MVFFSQRVLLELTTLVLQEKNLIKLFKKCNGGMEGNSSFYDKIISDKKITNKIPVNKLKKLFNFSYHKKN